MIGPHPQVRDALSQSLALHLKAVEFYSAVSAWFAPRYPKLGAKYRADADEEMGHARAVMDRMRFYDLSAVLSHDGPSWPESDSLEDFLQASLDLEVAANESEAAGLAACYAHGDEQTAVVFRELQAGSQKSILEIEAAQQAIFEIGSDNYLAAFL